MTEFKTENESSQGTSPVELIDCGQASKKTRGIPLVLLFELGHPPFNKLFLI